MPVNHRFRRFCAGLLAAALIISLAQAQTVPAGSADAQGVRAGSAQAQKDESLAPTALGKHARLDEPGGKPRRSLWPWIIGGAVVLSVAVAATLMNKPKRGSSNSPYVTGSFAVQVLAPSAGSLWALGDLVTVRWTSDPSLPVSAAAGRNTTEVRIDALREGKVAAVLLASTPNDGSEELMVPASLTPSNGYQIRVSFVAATEIFGDSDPFPIGLRKTETCVWDYSIEGQPSTAQLCNPATARAKLRVSGFGRVERALCRTSIRVFTYYLDPALSLTDVGLMGPTGIRKPIAFLRSNRQGEGPTTFEYQGEWDASISPDRAGTWELSATSVRQCSWAATGYIVTVALTLTYLTWD